jgi:hypothetical protein
MNTNKNTVKKASLIHNLAAQHYETGRQDKCWRAVWANHVQQVYPMCYRTFLNYIRLAKTEPKVKVFYQKNIFGETEILSNPKGFKLKALNNLKAKKEKE